MWSLRTKPTTKWIHSGRNPARSNGASTIDDTGDRANNVASAYEHGGDSPDEIVECYPDLSLADIHTALAFDDEHFDEFRSPFATPAAV